MKPPIPLGCVAILLLVAILPVSLLDAQSPFQVKLRSNAQGWTITWPARLVDAKGLEQFPSFELQRSEDLKSWSRAGALLQGSPAAANELLAVRFTTDAPKGFYRVVARSPSEPRISKLGQGGAEV